MKPYYHRDSQGTPLRVGQRVAYNMSGDVVPGEIVRISTRISILHTGRPVGLYHGKDDHISKVRNSSSILVLSEPDSSGT
jgi:hypothetical protein